MLTKRKLSPPLCRDLSAAVAPANADSQVKAIVITGAAPAFCAGAGLDDLQAAAQGEMSGWEPKHCRRRSCATCAGGCRTR